MWEIGEQHTAFAVLGGVDLDLREAVFTGNEAVISAYTVMGGIDVIVNAWTHVFIEGIGILGDFSQSRDRVPAEIGPDSPIVRIKGFALMGGVNVVRKPMPGEPRQSLPR